MAYVLPGLARRAGRIAVNALINIWVGAILFGAGFLHAHKKINQVDARYFRILQDFLNGRIGAAFFQRVWFLGRTPFTLFWMGVLMALNWRCGLIAGGIYGLAAGLEGGIKLLVARPRPFTAFPDDAAMLQPKRPRDFSFPSGDCFRVWFLALAIPAFWGLAWPLYALSGGIALIVTLGRVALGVHYPLDAISGTGLGFLSAGLTVLAWQVWVFF